MDKGKSALRLVLLCRPNNTKGEEDRHTYYAINPTNVLLLKGT